MFRVCKAILLPPVGAAFDEPGNLSPDLVVDAWQQLLRLVVIDDPDRTDRAGILAEREPRPVCSHLRRRGRDAVAETAVDRGFRRPQDRERLAALAKIVELAAHQLPQDPTAPMARQDPDPGHTTRGELTARHRQPERKRGGGPDRSFTVVGHEETIARKHLPVALEVLVLLLLAECGLGYPHRGPELFFARISDLNRHAFLCFHVKCSPCPSFPLLRTQSIRGRRRAISLLGYVNTD